MTTLRETEHIACTCISQHFQILNIQKLRTRVAHFNSSYEFLLTDQTISLNSRAVLLLLRSNYETLSEFSFSLKESLSLFAVIVITKLK